MKLLIPLIALALFAGCETPQQHYSAQELAAWDAHYKKLGIGPYAPPRGSRTSSEPSEPSAVDALIAEHAAQQARDDAQLAQQQRESDAAQHIMQMSNLSQNEAEGLVHEAVGGPDR